MNISLWTVLTKICRPICSPYGKYVSNCIGLAKLFNIFSVQKVKYEFIFCDFGPPYSTVYTETKFPYSSFLSHTFYNTILSDKIRTFLQGLFLLCLVHCILWHIQEIAFINNTYHGYQQFLLKIYIFKHATFFVAELLLYLKHYQQIAFWRRIGTN